MRTLQYSCGGTITAGAIDGDRAGTELKNKKAALAAFLLLFCHYGHLYT
jgi:hypothetical protein